MPKKKHASNASLGKTLQNRQAAKFKVPNDAGYKVVSEPSSNIPLQHTTDFGSEQAKPQLASVLEQNSLQEFINFAELS